MNLYTKPKQIQNIENKLMITKGERLGERKEQIRSMGLTDTNLYIK